MLEATVTINILIHARLRSTDLLEGFDDDSNTEEAFVSAQNPSSSFWSVSEHSEDLQFAIWSRVNFSRQFLMVWRSNRLPIMVDCRLSDYRQFIITHHCSTRRLRRAEAFLQPMLFIMYQNDSMCWRFSGITTICRLFFWLLKVWMPCILLRNQ